MRLTKNYNHHIYHIIKTVYTHKIILLIFIMAESYSMVTSYPLPLRNAATPAQYPAKSEIL